MSGLSAHQAISMQRRHFKIQKETNKKKSKEKQPKASKKPNLPTIHEHEEYISERKRQAEPSTSSTTNRKVPRTSNEPGTSSGSQGPVDDSVSGRLKRLVEARKNSPNPELTKDDFICILLG